MSSESHRGFGLLELMISVTILAVVSGATFLIFMSNQQLYHAGQEYATAVQNARIALDTICRYVRQAGNNPGSAAFASLAYSAPTLTVRSDLTGSQAAQNPLNSWGDPDKQLTAAYEQITVRYDTDSKSILLDVGYGEDTLAENITKLEYQFYDDAGAVTADMSQASRITVTLQAESSNKDPRTHKPNSITLSSSVYVRSKAFTPFG